MPDPASAPPRPDITFLRRRTRPAPAPKIDYTHLGRARRPPPAAPPPAPTPAPPASSSLDLSAPAAPPAPAPQPSASTSLDLSAVPAPSRPDVPTRPAPPPRRTAKGARIGAGDHHVLSVKLPTVALTRTQSGVGHLDVEGVWSADLGDARLGALYQLRSGGSSTVQHAGGHRFAPASSRRPVLVAAHEEYERISVDLRQVRDLERLAIYAVSESRQQLKWGGTLVLTTFGGGRIELPLESLYPGPVAVLLSLYNFDGELVIRAEMEALLGDVRDAARAYGYDRITWRDDRTPVD